MSAPAPTLIPARFHRPELDALRFGAFALVFLHHALPHSSGDFAGIPRIAAQLLAALGRAGALGVDLFFALSAYLITELLLRERRVTGTLDIRAFYVRRILRIWPLYFVALLVLAPAMGGMSPGYTAAFALLSGNWMCAIAGFPSSPFALLWSVSIEEQFYLVWPWLLRRVNLTSAAVAMLVIATVTRVALAMGSIQHPGVWCNTFARLDPIAGGALLAQILQGRLPQQLRSASVWVGAMTLLAIGAWGAHSGWFAVAAYPLTAAAAVAILYGTLGRGCENRALLYLGKISFGLYVFHVAAIELAGPLLGLPLSIATAALSYRYLESPFLRIKERFTRVPSVRRRQA